MKKAFLGAVASILTVAISLAEDTRNELIVFPGDFVASHVADGANWSTTIALVNLGGEEQTGTVYFWQDGRRLLPMDFEEFGQTSSLEFSIPAYGVFTAKTTGQAATVSTGFAVMIPDDVATDEIGDTTIFSYSVPGVIALEAAVPFGNILQKKNTLFFDHRNGYASGVAIVNPSAESKITVSLNFRRHDGSLLMSTSIPMNALGHTSFMLTDAFPELVGEAWSVEISGQATTGANSGVLVLGLRANPTGPFTTVFPVLPLSGFLDSIE